MWTVAAASLSTATEIFAGKHSGDALLLSQLLTASALMQITREGSAASVTAAILNTVARPFGIDEGTEAARTVEIFGRMAEVAVESSTKTFGSLVLEVGNAIVSELSSQGHNAQVLAIFREVRPKLAAHIFGLDSPEAYGFQMETQWFELTSVGSRAVSSHAIMQLQRELARFLDEPEFKTSDPELISACAAYQRAREGVVKIANGDTNNIVAMVIEVIGEFEDALSELDREGVMDEISAFTSSFISAASKVVEDLLRQRASSTRSGSERDAFANVKPGEIVDAPVHSLLIGQPLVSRHFVAWLLPFERPDYKYSSVAKSMVLPTFEALASLYSFGNYSERIETALEIRKIALNIMYAHLPSDSPDNRRRVSRVRVKVSELYSLRTAGEPEDNVDAVSVYCDDLDFATETDNYYPALRALLKASAIWLREDRDAPFRGRIASRYADEALGVFKGQGFAIERGLLLFRYGAAIEKVIAEVGDEEARQELASIGLGHLDSAERVLDPVFAPDTWTTIQICRAHLAEHARPAWFGRDSWAVLCRAKVFLPREHNPLLWGKIELEVARRQLRLPVLILPTVQSFFENSLAAFRDTGTSEELVALFEYGELLLEQARIVEAEQVLGAALSLAERRYSQSESMAARRVATIILERVAKSLAYCSWKSGEFDKAVVALERGQCRMLRDAIAQEEADLSGLSVSNQARIDELKAEVRRLESEAHGGLGSIEGVEGLTDARRELETLMSGASPLDDGEHCSVSDLTDIPRESAIVIPLLHRRGAVAFILTSGSAHVSAENVIALPQLSSDAVHRWLHGSDGWLNAYTNRLRDEAGDRLFRHTIHRFSGEIYTTLFAPILDRLRRLGVKEIVFVPNGGLQILPLHCAGPDDSEAIDARPLLLDEFRFRLAPSSSVFGKLRARGLRSRRVGLSVVAGVGEYDEEELAALPSVEAEAKSIAVELNVECLLNEQVTSERLAELVRDAPYIHLACHGAAWAEDPFFSRHALPNNALIFKRGDFLSEIFLPNGSFEPLGSYHCQLAIRDLSILGDLGTSMRD